MSRSKPRTRSSSRPPEDAGTSEADEVIEDDTPVAGTPLGRRSAADSQVKWLVGAIVVLSLVVALLAVMLVRQELTRTDATTTPATAAGTAPTAVPRGAAAGPVLPGPTVAGPVVTGTPATTGPGGIGPLGDRARRQANDPLAQGNVNAPVVMLIYEDYACPFCIKFSLDQEPKLKAKYVDTGKLRFEWRDLPIFGAESELAATAGRAAGNQGKFWEYKAALHQGAPATGKPSFNREMLLEHARQVGIKDMARFERDMNDPNVKAKVMADRQEAAQVGFTSTPSFVVHGRPVVGARPLADFEAVIDQALASAAG